MSVLQNKPLLLLATKIGLRDETKVLSKASEYLRLLNVRMTGSSINDTAKTIICLHLATGMLGVNFDMVSAMKYAGLKKPSYVNNKNTIENILELNKQLTVSVLCNKLDCGSVKPLADSILHKYKELNTKITDWSHPQYVCMAVYQACKLQRVRMSKAKMLAAGRLKPTQWTRLEGEWGELAQKHFAQPQGKVQGVTVEDIVALRPDNDDVENENRPAGGCESYEKWKSRILAKSYRELEEMKREMALVYDKPIKEIPPQTPPKELAIRDIPTPPLPMDPSKGVRLLFK